MHQFKTWLVTAFAAAMLAAGGPSATAAETETIDRMVTGTFGNYPLNYSVGWGFQVFPFADYFVLNDGSSWDSGAGVQSAYNFSGTVAVERADGMLQFTFAPPSSGILYSGTDYSYGDHSAQGVLGVTGPLVLEARRGSRVGVMRGYVSVLSNDATYYDTFNYYSASVGQSVYFETTFTLTDARFRRSLFEDSFTYNLAGYVDFTNVQAVPEPAGAWTLAAGLAVVGFAWKRRGRRTEAEA